MRKLVGFLFALLLLLSLSACESPKEPSGVDTSFATSYLETTTDSIGSSTDQVPITTTIESPVTTETTHTHTFSPATCTTPKACTECGATEGNANGHMWTDATCSSPKTCSACGATEGNANGHMWTDATCSSPKTCSTCGATEGKAKGHQWKNATCTMPKTCTECGATSGSTIGHKFSDGECTMCGKADPNYAAETMVWIPTKGGKKYHTRKDCSNMKDPECVTESEAESRGFTPCKKCH